MLFMSRVYILPETSSPAATRKHTADGEVKEFQRGRKGEERNLQKI